MVFSFGHLVWSEEKDMVEGGNDKAALPLERSRNLSFLSFLTQAPEKGDSAETFAVISKRSFGAHRRS